jgi:hypothetical protein
LTDRTARKHLEWKEKEREACGPSGHEILTAHCGKVASRLSGEKQ